MLPGTYPPPPLLQHAVNIDKPAEYKTKQEIKACSRLFLFLNVNSLHAYATVPKQELLLHISVQHSTTFAVYVTSTYLLFWLQNIAGRIKVKLLI